MNNSYQVVWTIDIDAPNPTEAAQKAFEIQRDVNSTATVFEVKEEKAFATKTTIIDLKGNDSCSCQNSNNYIASLLSEAAIFIEQSAWRPNGKSLRDKLIEAAKKFR